MTKDFSDFKLTIAWKPSAYHYKTIRKSITATLWRKIRMQVLKDNNCTCSICGYTTQSQAELRKLHVHEVEEYGETELLCTLKNLNLICARCHSFHHFRRTISVLNKDQMEDLKQHFMRVNKCTKDDYIEYLKMIKKTNRDAILISIKQPIESIVVNNDREVKFRIEGDIPYKYEVIEQLKKKDLYYIQ